MLHRWLSIGSSSPIIFAIAGQRSRRGDGLILNVGRSAGEAEGKGEMKQLNEALLWLAEHQGRISFSGSVEDRFKDLSPEAPVINVEALADTGKPCSGVARIHARDAAVALLAAINVARG